MSSPCPLSLVPCVYTVQYEVHGLLKYMCIFEVRTNMYEYCGPVRHLPICLRLGCG